MRQLLDFALLSNKEYQSQQAAGYSLSVKNGKFLSTVKNRNQDFRSVKLGETPKDAGYAPSLSSKGKSLAVFLIVASFVFPLADALEIGTSPAEVSLKLMIKEEQCFALQVFGEKGLLLTAYDVWDTLPPAMRYQKHWKMAENREQHEVCVSGKESGIYR